MNYLWTKRSNYRTHTQPHMRKLKTDINQINKLIHVVNTHYKYRQARSLIALGAVLKYIAGIPDHDDFDIHINN